MGKNRIRKIIGGLIAGMTAHKILAEHTNRPESIHHLEIEINNYRENISDIIKKFNWGDIDKEIIKREAERILHNEFKKPHFSDIKFPEEEKDIILDDIIRGIFQYL